MRRCLITDIEKILKVWGRNVSLTDENGKVVTSGKCFIQALRYKNKMYIEGTPTEAGVSDAGYYLLIGPKSFSAGRGGSNARLSDGEKTYAINRIEKIYFGKDIFFTWAVIRECDKGNYPVYRHFT